MTFSFKGKTVVITGASRGIGLGIAKGFSQAGATLHLVARDEKVQLEAETLHAKGYLADITSSENVEQVLSQIGKIDVLINNAGLEQYTPIVKQGSDVDATFRLVIETNIVGTATVTRAAIPRMSRGGAIINTSSIWGRVSEAGFDAYVASKHAIIGLTKTWSKELGPLGIRVNVVCPGWVKTDASMRSLGVMAEREGVAEGDLLNDIVAGQSLPGLMVPEDMAGTYMFLASDAAANITGQSLGVDRGEVPW